jgi:hypothetical protein
VSDIPFKQIAACAETELLGTTSFAQHVAHVGALKLHFSGRGKLEPLRSSLFCLEFHETRSSNARLSAPSRMV